MWSWHGLIASPCRSHLYQRFQHAFLNDHLVLINQLSVPNDPTAPPPLCLKLFDHGDNRNGVADMEWIYKPPVPNAE